MVGLLGVVILKMIEGTVMDCADIPKPRILVAHSYGALVAIAYAVRHPSEIAGMASEQLKRLTTIAAAAFP